LTGFGENVPSAFTVTDTAVVVHALTANIAQATTKAITT